MKRVWSELVNLGRRFVGFQWIHRNDGGEMGLQPIVLNSGFQHRRRAVGKDGSRKIVESFESGSCIGEHGGREVRIEKLLNLRLARFYLKLRKSGAERGFSDVPEILIAVHERAQPGEFELLLPPELGESVQIAAEGGAGTHHDGVNVEQCPIRIKQESSIFFQRAGHSPVYLPERDWPTLVEASLRDSDAA